MSIFHRFKHATGIWLHYYVKPNLIKFKWSIDEILEHEKQLYPEKERFTRTQLEEFCKISFD